MGKFHVTESALAATQTAVALSKCAQPVATLRDAMDVVLTTAESEEVRSSLWRNKNRLEDEVAAVLIDRYGTQMSDGGAAIELCVFEQTECSPTDLCSVGGIVFALPRAIREPVSDCWLDYQNGRYVLQRNNRAFTTVLSFLRST